MMNRRGTALVILAAAALTASGCDSFQQVFRTEPDPNRFADVSIDRADGNTQNICIEVNSSDKASRQAIKDAQMKNWESAEANARTAISNGKETSFNEHFAHAVILERNGKFDEAIASYEAANSAQSDSRCPEGKERCLAKKTQTRTTTAPSNN
jgi:hypothetical protein